MYLSADNRIRLISQTPVVRLVMLSQHPRRPMPNPFRAGNCQRSGWAGGGCGLKVFFRPKQTFSMFQGRSQMQHKLPFPPSNLYSHFRPEPALPGRLAKGRNALSPYNRVLVATCCPYISTPSLKGKFVTLSQLCRRVSFASQSYDPYIDSILT
jgi:hypothetical protein